MNKETVAADSTPSSRMSPVVAMSVRELITTIVAGLAVGIIVAGVSYLMNKYVFGVVLCRPQSPDECQQAPGYAMIVAMVVGAITGLVSLARLRVYRPLLIVLAATIALWSVRTLTIGLRWYIGTAIIAGFFAFTYGLFAWVSRIRSFILAIIVATALVIAMRYIMVA